MFDSCHIIRLTVVKKNRIFVTSKSLRQKNDIQSKKHYNT